MFVILRPTNTFHAAGFSAKPKKGEPKPSPRKRSGCSIAATVLMSAPKLR